MEIPRHRAEKPSGYYRMHTHNNPPDRYRSDPVETACKAAQYVWQKASRTGERTDHSTMRNCKVDSSSSARLEAYSMYSNTFTTFLTPSTRLASSSAFSASSPFTSP